MTDTIETRAGVPVLLCSPTGPTITESQDALDLIGAAFSGAEAVVIPVSRLDRSFFTLSTGLAGEIMQKFVNYRLRLAIVGDMTEFTEASGALRDLIRESNKGTQIWFLPSLEDLDARLQVSAR
jgi:hypothetical protein